MSGQVIRPTARISGSIRVPGDKSISHRALIVAAIGEGPCSIAGLSPAADVASTRACLSQLGVAISETQPQPEHQDRGTSDSEWEILVDGRGVSALSEPDETLDCGNSGTTIRCLAGVAARCRFATTFDGDESLRRRPMERVAAPLREMGAEIFTTEGRPPLTISGGALQGIDYAMPVASGQIKTAIVLAALGADGETVIRDPGASRDHTERLLECLGVPIQRSTSQLIVKSTRIQNALSLQIPGDLSSAAFLLVAAAILPSSDLSIEDVGVNPTRIGILDILKRYGADVSVEDVREICGEPRATVRIRAGDRRPVEVGPDEVPAAIDELPLVAVLGAFAEGETTLHGAAELRVKESDRIAAVAAGLSALGVDIATRPDGFTVRGGRPLRGGVVVDSAGDHRIAMAMAVALLAAGEPGAVDGWEAVGVSYPEFERDLAAVTVPA